MLDFCRLWQKRNKYITEMCQNWINNPSYHHVSPLLLAKSHHHLYNWGDIIYCDAKSLSPRCISVISCLWHGHLHIHTGLQSEEPLLLWAEEGDSSPLLKGIIKSLVHLDDHNGSKWVILIIMIHQIWSHHNGSYHHHKSSAEIRVILYRHP